MEFLMTYGWAVLIMLVVVAVLFYVGVFTPSGPNVCYFPSGFSCYEYKLSDGGNLTLDLGQGTGKEITLIGFSCSELGNATMQGIVHVDLKSGRHTLITPSPRCVKADGSYPSAGEYFAGKLSLLYNETGTDISHTVTGDIAYIVEP
jgi:hypothetical protein